MIDSDLSKLILHRAHHNLKLILRCLSHRLHNFLSLLPAFFPYHFHHLTYIFFIYLVYCQIPSQLEFLLQAVFVHSMLKSAWCLSVCSKYLLN